MARALTIAIALAALLAGCGSGDGGGDASREDFVADANAICRDGEREVTGKFDGEQPTPESLEQLADAYQPYLERLRALDPPRELEPGWREFVAGVDEGFELLPDLAEATQSQDEDRLREISERAEQIADDTRPFAQTNGLDGCLPDDG
jgi:hypothetical protein